MIETRDVSPLYFDLSVSSNGACRVCGAVPTDRDEHARLHLADASAVVQGDTLSGTLRWRVVPTSSFPPIVDKLVLPTKRMDAKLRALARAALRRVKPCA